LRGGSGDAASDVARSAAVSPHPFPSCVCGAGCPVHRCGLWWSSVDDPGRCNGYSRRCGVAGRRQVARSRRIAREARSPGRVGELKEAARVERPDRSSQGAHKPLASFSGERPVAISPGHIPWSCPLKSTAEHIR
jgi:hypothetical protein